MDYGWGFVDEIPELLKPAPHTEDELTAAAKITDADYAIYTEKLGIICEEAKEIFIRSGRAGMLLAGDLILGIYNSRGDLVTGMAGAYIHAVTATPAIKYTLERWANDPSVGLKEGDMWLNSDPLYGGLHPPDLAGFIPYFYNGQLIAWIAAAVHEGDTGAKGPAMSPLSISRWEQGLPVTPLKIGEDHQLRQDIIHLISSDCRSPEMMEVDIRARMTACSRIAERLDAIIEEKGTEFLVGLMCKMMIETEEGSKRRIRDWNDGKYRSVIFFDSAGSEEGLIKELLTVEKKGDRITFDFTECSPENYSASNTFPHMGIAHALNVLYWGVFSELPTSTALLSALDFKFKPGTFLYASKWASTMLAPPSLTPLMVIVEICFSKMMYAHEPDRKLVFASMGSHGNMSFSAMNQWGFHVADLHNVLLNAMGGGGRPDRDGDDSFFFCHCPWGKAQEIEDMEVEMPFIHLNCSHLPDEGGFGKYRGGSGVTVTLETHLVPAGAMSSWGAGSRIPQTPGLFGGYPSNGTPTIQVKDTNLEEKLERGEIILPENAMELASERPIPGEYFISAPVAAAAGAFKRGELYVQTRSGGGGYGDVLERDPDMVMRDLQNKTATHHAAQEVYKVVYEPDTLEVDYEKTKELRQQAREERKKLGKKYDDWVKGWSIKKPPEKALKWYGNWPDGSATAPLLRI